MKSLIIAAGAAVALSFGTAQAQTADHTIVGIGAVYAAVYQGADDYRTLPMPAIDIVSGPFFANLRNGIGVNVIDTDTFTMGGSVALMTGYRRKDVPEGVDKLNFGAGGRIFTSIKAGGMIATLGGTQGFAGSTKGFIADASIAYPLPISSRFMLIPSVGTTWADRKHNDRYFGIDADEVLASGLPRFRGRAGFKDISAMIAASYRLNSRVNLTVSGGVTTLVGDVVDSPLVEHKTRPVGTVSLSYRLGS